MLLVQIVYRSNVLLVLLKSLLVLPVDRVLQALDFLGEFLLVLFALLDKLVHLDTGLVDCRLESLTCCLRLLNYGVLMVYVCF